ncbi:Zonular occludens toxin (Zot) [Verrucomicrobium sp. GAS474]|uniref:zonular occludens toxin domain-containing protein n=1 Tax=Verrucomicrobium sp. GAS474 TaxID=1882831 RepID=UPI000879DC2E|nr:zonular occludens toxin domain-containing protein [Verrucomicrobium sp. GAS474]SDU18170.1 Zonular occludens toxin (Zot) [Verrucomicrobium sp. GAS474]
MIHVYEGRPGGGKSYRAVENICKDLAAGSIVHTNIFLYPEKVRAYVFDRWGVEVPPDSLVYYEDGSKLAHDMPSLIPRGTRACTNKIYLDEAHIWYNSRDWKTTHELLKRNLVWLTQHRKFFVDVVFITQDAANIDAQFRRLAQSYYRFRDLQKMKAPGFGQVYPLPHTLEILVDYDGKTVMDRTFVPRKKEIFDLYESEQLLMNHDFLIENKTSKVVKNKKKTTAILVRKTLEVSLTVVLFGMLIYLGKQSL